MNKYPWQPGSTDFCREGVALAISQWVWSMCPTPSFSSPPSRLQGPHNTLRGCQQKCSVMAHYTWRKRNIHTSCTHSLVTRAGENDPEHEVASYPGYRGRGSRRESLGIFSKLLALILTWVESVCERTCRAFVKLVTEKVEW